MATPWHFAPAAQAILARIRPGDLAIHDAWPIVGPKRFVWSIDERTERALADLRYQAVTDQLGYSFADADHDRERRKAWLAALNHAPSVHDAMVSRFGDPETLRGYGLDMARRIWRERPGCLTGQRSIAA